MTAIAISSTEYLCAWYMFRDWGDLRYEQQVSQFRLKGISDDIERYRVEKGMLPSTLSMLYPKPDLWEDMWHRPFIYTVEDGRYELYSFGRDGAPGGEGFDADIYSDRPMTGQHALTLWEFTNAWGVEGIQMISLLTGAVAFPLFFVRRKNKHFRSQRFGRLSRPPCSQSLPRL
jgi:Type II secretion system (T2SS), protein G